MGNEAMTRKMRNHCRSCGRSTQHEVLADDETITPWDRDGDFKLIDRYTMIKCMGCGTAALRWVFGIDGDPGTFKEVIYPPPMIRRTPAWATDALQGLVIPQPILDLMRETYVAVQNDLTRLAAMGVRAALEQVMIEKVGDQKSFNNNLSHFEQDGYISARQRKLLASILEAGHAAIHRAWQPTRMDVSHLLDIAESIIESVYLHEGHAVVLEARVPRRNPPNKC
jgi:hypothetical protein